MCTDCKTEDSMEPVRSIQSAQLRGGSLQDSVDREKSAISTVVQDLFGAMEYANMVLNDFILKVDPASAQTKDEGIRDNPATEVRGSSKLCYSLEELLQQVYNVQRRIISATQRVEL